MPSKLNAELVQQIRNELQAEETADLVEIWQTNDTSEWTAEGFEAVRALLVERLGPIPARAKSASWAAGLEIRAQRHLDRATALEEKGKFDQALTECETAARIAPGMAVAHNRRGLLLDARHHVLEAMDAYRAAIRLNPRFSEARENLRDAEREWLDVDSPDRPPGPAELDDPAPSADDVIQTGPLPASVYLSDASRIMPGWPGYRTRPGRSGYDYLDTAFEEAHMEGVLLRLLFTGKLRTGSRVGLIFLVALGIMAISPLFFAGLELADGHTDYLALILIFSVIWVPGLALFWNVALNIVELMNEK